MENLNEFKGYLINATKYSDIGEYDIALDMVKKMHEIAPNNDFVYLISASIKLAAENYSDCIDDSKICLNINPNNAKGWNMLGVAHCSSGEIKEGLIAFEKGIELGDNDCNMNYNYWIKKID